MPVYRKISLDELHLWLSDLKILLLRIYKYPTKSSVLYFVISLYEYVQVLAKLCLLNVDEAENIKITVKDIKDYLSNNDNLLSIINSFKTLRDDASHGFVSDSKFMKSYIKILCSDDFLLLIDSLNLDSELIKLIKTVLKRLKVCFTSDYKNNCLQDCKRMLQVNENEGSSNYTVSEVVSNLKSKYDLYTIYSGLMSVIGSEYVV